MDDLSRAMVRNAVERFAKTIECVTALLADAIRYHADATRTAYAKCYENDIRQADLPKWIPNCPTCKTPMIMAKHGYEETWICPNPDCPERLHKEAE